MWNEIRWSIHLPRNILKQLWTFQLISIVAALYVFVDLWKTWNLENSCDFYFVNKESKDDTRKKNQQFHSNRIDCYVFPVEFNETHEKK